MVSTVMEVWAGTSGYSYKKWKGPFYPADLSDKEMLHFYGTQLPAVEIDNTFYRIPKRSVLENWAEQTPPEFRFTIKASRRITHLSRLKEADEPMSFLMRNVRTLGPKLGCVLFQLPPFLKKDLERLEKFLPLIPEDIPAAFEFRHPSWEDEEVYDCLRARNIALCLADTDTDAAAADAESENGANDVSPSGPTPGLVSTANWGYLRLRRPTYSDADLAEWATKIRGENWDRVFLFFKHEDDGVAPQMAAKMITHLTQ